ncbi:MAG: pseudouridylate synthase [Myxococcales bacterium]|jgi:tRNA pseudouridine65 synthase|nr:pseudouridylate synthase [Myxococcales bacterium]
MISPPDCLFADEHLVLVNKPSGLLVHRGLGQDRVVAMSLVRDALGRHVFPVHRLDRGTSGVLCFALSSEMAAALQRSFTEGGVHKRYLALVRGVPPDQALIDHPVPKCEGGERVSALTEMRRLATARFAIGDFSLVEAMPKTGRFHQIRRHLKHLGHPLVGDVNYGRGEINRFFRAEFGLNRLALHAASIAFQHPVTGESIEVMAPIPEELKRVIDLFGEFDFDRFGQ